MPVESSVLVDPLICPLCQKSNACVNVSSEGNAETCWCNDPEIKFPQKLLEQVPTDAKGLACICRACAMKYNVKYEEAR